MIAASSTLEAAAVVAHHLRLFGVAASSAAERSRSAAVLVRTTSGPDGSLPPADTEEPSRLTILLRPCPGVLASLGIGAIEEVPGPQSVVFPRFDGHAWSRVRTLHSLDVYHCESPHEVVATDSRGRTCWLTVCRDERVILIAGTEVGGDLIRYRQGDPARAAHPQTGALWGIPGERPTYLFDAQMPAGSEHDRQADWWTMAMASTIAECLGEPLPDLLPHGAPGAVVVTGDDDQAYLEKYQEQLELLDGLPITYFLHPLTRHTPKTLAAMIDRHRVELGLHPDALDHPECYADLFREQAAWFARLTGKTATLVRNHGFLNDGYWGHLPVWLERGVRVSANLPGVNGTVLNGSLLPARMAWEGQLTSHWSILTAIGDGVRFALGLDGPQSAQCIRDLADRIEQSGLPGVIVLNLHPQNVDHTREMHAALHEIKERGFSAMTLGECVDWFAERDGVQD